jgi:hypothetical protein
MARIQNLERAKRAIVEGRHSVETKLETLAQMSAPSKGWLQSIVSRRNMAAEVILAAKKMLDAMDVPEFKAPHKEAPDPLLIKLLDKTQEQFGAADKSSQVDPALMAMLDGHKADVPDDQPKFKTSDIAKLLGGTRVATDTPVERSPESGQHESQSEVVAVEQPITHPPLDEHDPRSPIFRRAVESGQKLVDDSAFQRVAADSKFTMILSTQQAKLVAAENALRDWKLIMLARPSVYKAVLRYEETLDLEMIRVKALAAILDEPGYDRREVRAALSWMKNNPRPDISEIARHRLSVNYKPAKPAEPDSADGSEFEVSPEDERLMYMMQASSKPATTRTARTTYTAGELIEGEIERTFKRKILQEKLEAQKANRPPKDPADGFGSVGW